MDGFIKVSRKLLDSAIWNDAYDAALFFYCLLRASHNRYEGLEPGQFYSSFPSMMKGLGWSRNGIKAHLRNLIAMGMIAVSEYTGALLITVINWASISMMTEEDSACHAMTPACHQTTTARHEMTAACRDMTAEVSQHDTYQKDNQKERQSVNRAQQFELWFQEYPRRNRKSEALKAWLKLDATAEVLTAALRNAKCSSQWLRENGRFIPAAVKFLDGDWENYVDHEETEASKAWTEY